MTFKELQQLRKKEGIKRSLSFLLSLEAKVIHKDLIRDAITYRQQIYDR